MRIKFYELLGKCQAIHGRISLQSMATETGIDRGMLTKIADGDIELINHIYVDALFTYFKRRLPYIDVSDLLYVSEIDLPIEIQTRGRKKNTPRQHNTKPSDS